MAHGDNGAVGAIKSGHGRTGGVSLACDPNQGFDIKNQHKDALKSGNVFDFAKTHPHFV